MTKDSGSRRSSKSELMDLQSFNLPGISNGETCIDHISKLPDSLIQHILSFLPMEDVFKTRFLSERWRSVWAEVPVLRFSFLSYRNSKMIIPFEEFVNKTLENYRENKVQKLDFRLRYDGYRSSCSSVEEWERSVKEWLRFSIKRKVEELRLVIFPKYGSYKSFQLPQCIYSNSSLQILETLRCDFEPSSSVSWTSLRRLSICYGKLSDDAVASIFLGSPNLEYLKLHLCEGVNKIIVNSSNIKLKELDLVNLRSSTSSTLEVSAPHVHSLRLHGYPRRRFIRFIKLINLSSLVEFNVRLFGGQEYKSLMGLHGEIHRIQKLNVNCESLEMLPSLPVKCRSLVVDSSAKEWDFHRILTLLQATPNLEKLTVIMDNYSEYEFEDDKKYWELMKINVKFEHLKSVEISGFEESWCVRSRLKFFTSMVEYLLKNATALEKMVIYAQSISKIELPDLFEVKKLISSYPKASVVEFKTSFNQLPFPEGCNVCMRAFLG